MAGWSVGSSTFADIALARYLPNGTLDTTFGGDGLVTTDIGVAAMMPPGPAVALQPDGKIVAAGWSVTSSTGHRSFALARYQPERQPWIRPSAAMAW